MSLLRVFDSVISKKPPACSAVIAAAGSSQRCKGEDKLLYKINGKPVLAYSIEAFQNCPLVREIVVVARPEQLEMLAGMCRGYGFSKVSKVIAGGETRAQSVISGVFALSGKAKLIAIHDGARPCTSPAIIERTLHKAAKYHAAAPGVPIASTVKRADSPARGDYGPVITETVDRGSLYEIQTPQIFMADIIKAALTNAALKSIALTDDCMAVELIGMPVHIVPGERRNIKITQYDDLEIAEALIWRENRAIK